MVAAEDFEQSLMNLIILELAVAKTLDLDVSPLGHTRPCEQVPTS